MADDSPARKKDLSAKRLFREGELDFEDLQTLLINNAKRRAAHYRDNLGKVLRSLIHSLESNHLSSLLSAQHSPPASHSVAFVGRVRQCYPQSICPFKRINLTKSHLVQSQPVLVRTLLVNAELLTTLFS